MSQQQKTNRSVATILHLNKESLSSCTSLVLPVQCKGVVELHMWVWDGVKGGKLLQSLHQLYDGLIILDDKSGTRRWVLQHFHDAAVTMDHRTGVLQTSDPSHQGVCVLLWGQREFLRSLYSRCHRIDSLLNPPQKPLQMALFITFLLLLLAYIVTIPTARWIIQPVLDACCSNESFMRLPVVSGRIWMASAIAMQRLKTGKGGKFKMSRPKASPGALYRQPAIGLRLEKESTYKKKCHFSMEDADRLIPRRWPLSDSYRRVRTPPSRSRTSTLGWHLYPHCLPEKLFPCVTCFLIGSVLQFHTDLTFIYRLRLYPSKGRRGVGGLAYSYTFNVIDPSLSFKEYCINN